MPENAENFHYMECPQNSGKKSTEFWSPHNNKRKILAAADETAVERCTSFESTSTRALLNPTPTSTSTRVECFTLLIRYQLLGSPPRGGKGSNVRRLADGVSQTNTLRAPPSCLEASNSLSQASESGCNAPRGPDVLLYVRRTGCLLQPNEGCGASRQKETTGNRMKKRTVRWIGSCRGTLSRSKLPISVLSVLMYSVAPSIAAWSCRASSRFLSFCVSTMAPLEPRSRKKALKL